MSDELPILPFCTGPLLKREDGSFYFKPMAECDCPGCRFFVAATEGEKAHERAKVAYADFRELIRGERVDK